jgi:hypothetical protein
MLQKLLLKKEEESQRETEVAPNEGERILAIVGRI